MITYIHTSLVFTLILLVSSNEQENVYDLCGVGDINTALNGTITYGSLSNWTAYELNPDCERAIIVPEGHRIKLQIFNYSTTHQYYDRLYVYDGGYSFPYVSELAYLEPQSAWHYPHFTATNALFLRFESYKDFKQYKPGGIIMKFYVIPPETQPLCECPRVLNGTVKCKQTFMKTGNMNGDMKKVCQVQCPGGQEIAHHNFHNILTWNSSPATVKCSQSSGKWLWSSTLFNAPTMFHCSEVSYKDITRVYSFRYLNATCDFLESSFPLIQQRYIDFVKNLTFVNTRSQCFVDNPTSCTAERITVNCTESTKNDSKAVITIFLTDQASKETKSTAGEFLNLVGGYVRNKEIVLFPQNENLDLDINGTFYAVEKGVSQDLTSNWNLKTPDCPSGMYYFKHFYYCGQCPLNSRPGVYLTCIFCPNGTRQNQTDPASDCEPGEANIPTPPAQGCSGSCPLGRKYNETFESCSWCPRNSYQASGSILNPECTACPEGKVTGNTGAGNISECITPCSLGTFMETSGNCSNCTRGTFMDESKHAYQRCKVCPKSMTTLLAGSDDEGECVHDCAKGSYLDISSKECFLCQNNTYQDEKVQLSCKKCPNGTVTINPGASSVTLCYGYCPSGTFLNELNAGKCEICPKGTYQSSKKHTMTSCISCDEHKTTPAEGSDDVKNCSYPCTKGYFFNLTSIECEKCPVHTYQNVSGQSECVKCPTEMGTPGQGHDNAKYCVLPCPAGTKVNVESRVCEDCPVGSYQEATNHTLDSCTECPVKKTTKKPGSTVSSDCVWFCSLAPCENGGECENLESTFICSCPTGLEGVRCEQIIDTEKVQLVVISVNFTSLEWRDELLDNSSQVFQTTARKIKENVRMVLKDDKTFRVVEIQRFVQGSVVVELVIKYIPDGSLNSPVEIFENNVESGSIGNMTVGNNLTTLSQSCSEPLGMENKRIPDSALTGTDSNRDGHKADKARLNIDDYDAWCAAEAVADPYLQVDIGIIVRITGVASQGKYYASRVTNYSLSFSMDEEIWTKYEEAGVLKVFQGNTDYYTVVRHALTEPVTARLIRFHPLGFNELRCMRVEVYGCLTNLSIVLPTLPPVLTISPSTARPVPATSSITEGSSTIPKQEIKNSEPKSNYTVVISVVVLTVAVLVSIPVCILLYSKYKHITVEPVCSGLKLNSMKKLNKDKEDFSPILFHRNDNSPSVSFGELGKIEQISEPPNLDYHANPDLKQEVNAVSTV